MALSLYEASQEARRIAKSGEWSYTTRHVGILVSRNGRERVYFFDKTGRVCGYEGLDVDFVPLDLGVPKKP